MVGREVIAAMLQKALSILLKIIDPDLLLLFQENLEPTNGIRIREEEEIEFLRGVISFIVTGFPPCLSSRLRRQLKSPKMIQG